MTVQLGSAELIALLLCTIRVTTWLMIVPPFATAGIPRTVRYMLAVLLALSVTANASAHAPAAEIGPILGSAVEQIVIGGSLGFLTRVLFSAVESAGSLIDLVGGFSLASAYDPLLLTQTSIFGKFYGLMMSTLLFATGAHLMIIRGFLATFTAIPLDASINLSHVGAASVTAVTTMWVSALQIAGPLIAILFLADVALGLLAKISPQLNVFQVSFPFKILITLGLVGTGFSMMPQTISQITDNAVRLVAAVAGTG